LQAKDVIINKKETEIHREKSNQTKMKFALQVQESTS